MAIICGSILCCSWTCHESVVQTVLETDRPQPTRLNSPSGPKSDKAPEQPGIPGKLQPKRAKVNFSEPNLDAKPTTNQSASAHLIVMGISYHSCPIFVREKFVIPESCIGHALGGLARMPHINEAAILSTCNRTEVYAVVSDVQAGMKEIESFFLSAQTVSDHDVLKPNFRLLRDDVALHLFRVASGLDSMVLGEGQIMSQVKAAYKNALESGTAGPILGQLFQLALNCGKRVRTETSMGKRAVSVSSAAVELARDVLGPLRDRTTLIIGAGKMAQICGKHVMSEIGAGPVIMLNRTSERIEHFSGNKLPNKDRLKLGLSFEDRHQIAAAADLVIVATSAPKFLLEQQELKKHLQPGRVLTIVDISVPRNVDPSIRELENVRVFDADNLVSVVNKNIAERESLIDEAEQIVMDVLQSFHDWERSLLVAPTITELRKKIEAIREEHLVKIDRKQTQQEGRRDEFEDLSRALINQILHHPTTQLKSTSDYRSLKQQAEALRKLFNLDILSDPCTTRGDRERSKTGNTGEYRTRLISSGSEYAELATASTRRDANREASSRVRNTTNQSITMAKHKSETSQADLSQLTSIEVSALSNYSNRHAETSKVQNQSDFIPSIANLGSPAAGAKCPVNHGQPLSTMNTQAEFSSADYEHLIYETSTTGCPITRFSINLMSTIKTVVKGLASKALGKPITECPMHRGQKNTTAASNSNNSAQHSNK